MEAADLRADALVVVDVQRALVAGEHAVADAGPYLDRWTAALASARAAGVPVVHLQSEMCVAATARGALDRGMTVILPRDGHTTYAVPGDVAPVGAPPQTDGRA